MKEKMISFFDLVERGGEHIKYLGLDILLEKLLRSEDHSEKEVITKQIKHEVNF